jgi:hypothetical protein
MYALKTTIKTMSKDKKTVEGGSPSPSGPHDDKRHKDESERPAKTVKQDAIKNSEKDNMTGQKGYNETPPTVPVKSSKESSSS